MNRVKTKESFSFPPRLRLSKPAEYKRVFSDSIRITDKYFTVLAAKNLYQHPRLGLAIAKRNIKKAVGRNRIKRLIRESFRLHQHQLGCLDIVVMARRDAASVPQSQLASALQRHWRRLIERCG